MMLEIALYQPDIAGNTGTIMRLCACLGVGLHIIGPAGFRFDDKALVRAGMDYVERATITRHDGWADFRAWQVDSNRRLVLFSTTGNQPSHGFCYRQDDILLFGRESGGVPNKVHEAADCALHIAMVEDTRSFNIAVAAALGLANALTEIGGWPKDRSKNG